jgi:peptidyl-prolyl cis-trans isomerase B (cyclophilin B)
MRASIVVVVLASLGCAVPTVSADRQDERKRILDLARDPNREFSFSVRPDGTPVAGDANAASPFTPDVALRIGASGRDDAAELVERAVAADAPPDVVAAAAMGLGMCKSDATERVLVALALRPSQPPEALEALFSYYRWRGEDKPAPAQLPDVKLLAYQDHATARGRAALAHLGRAVKDPVLVACLEKLSRDEDAEVRRAVAISLADGAKQKRLAADRERCLAVLAYLVRDPDPRVVVESCRAISTYTPPSALQVQEVLGATNHADFNVRVAALEGLGKFLTKEAPDWKRVVVAQMTKLATTDPSPSVRYTAAERLLEIGAALTLSDGLLADPSEYVRMAGVDVLAKSQDILVNPHLATIARTDPSLRVREQAVGAFEGKKDSANAKETVKAALADPDVGIASTACAVVAANGWQDLATELPSVLYRFKGCAGADAREAAITAMSDIDALLPPDHATTALRGIVEPYKDDPNPSVRAAAEKALAKLDKKDPPKETSRGADLTGDLLPGGAPIFDKDVFLVVETDKGTMRIRLFPEQAPVHCAHVASLARKGFYDGLDWHRVVPDFVIQGGCPRGDGSGNAGVSLPLEPTRIPFERGTLGMPRGDQLDTGGCQLFVCHSRAPQLDVRYTAFGKLVDGFSVLDKIDVDDKIVRVTVEGAH